MTSIAVESESYAMIDASCVPGQLVYVQNPTPEKLDGERTSNKHWYLWVCDEKGYPRGFSSTEIRTMFDATERDSIPKADL